MFAAAAQLNLTLDLLRQGGGGGRVYAGIKESRVQNVSFGIPLNAFSGIQMRSGHQEKKWRASTELLFVGSKEVWIVRSGNQQVSLKCMLGRIHTVLLFTLFNA